MIPWHPVHQIRISLLSVKITSFIDTIGCKLKLKECSFRKVNSDLIEVIHDCTATSEKKSGQLASSRLRDFVSEFPLRRRLGIFVIKSQNVPKLDYGCRHFFSLPS